MTHALPLLLALAFASDPAAEPPDAEAVQSYELASLGPGAAVQAEGKRLRFRVQVKAVVIGWDGAAAYYILDAPGRATATRIGHAPIPPHCAAEVEAELHLDYLPPTFAKDGTPHPAAWVYRLEKAAVVGP
jgi:hypothetical protein